MNFNLHLIARNTGLSIVDVSIACTNKFDGEEDLMRLVHETEDLTVLKTLYDGSPAHSHLKEVTLAKIARITHHKIESVTWFQGAIELLFLLPSNTNIQDKVAGIAAGYACCPDEYVEIAEALPHNSAKREAIMEEAMKGAESESEWLKIVKALPENSPAQMNAVAEYAQFFEMETA